MENYTLEVCVDSVESALAAAKAKADRLELCSNLVIGGTTPGIELFSKIRELSDIRIHVLIRPRFGDFLYSEYEYDIMRKEIEGFVKAGAEGIVIGSLNADGTLNQRQMKGMIEAAQGRSITMHRAFDVCVDPFETMEQAKELGVSTILTSGQERDCYSGRALIKELAKRAGDEIDILAGAGVNPFVIEKMVKETGVVNYHMSGKKTLDSQMSYRNPKVYMGLPGISEFEIWRTDEETIRQAVQLLKRL